MSEGLREALIEAMERFDRELRPQTDYEENAKYRYFIEHQGQRYPVKKIVSWATNRPLDMVRGRRSRIAVEEQGFTIIDIRPEQDAIQRAFDEFRQDPYDSFMVRVRRVRVKQLQLMIKQSAAMTSEIFNREIWNIESSTSLKGRTLQLAYLWDNLPDDELLSDLEQALEHGALELHGNYIWGSGSRVYAPRLKDMVQKEEYVRQALTILNDASLSPPEKAQRLESIYGFGPNISTGLVMVLHPTAFALFNVQSQQALQTLGYKIADNETFQEAITQLKDDLDAEDFLELDLFLYLCNQGRYSLLPNSGFWWVNQGSSYDTERPGGYIFAHRKDKGGAIQQSHDLRRLHVGDITLHYARGAIRAIGRVVSPAVESEVPGGQYVGPEGNVAYQVSMYYHDLAEPIVLLSIPLAWRIPDAGPFDRDGKVKMLYLMPVSSGFVEKMTQRWPNELSTFISRVPNIWLFQANPEQFERGDPNAYLLQERVHQVSIGQEDSWRVTRYGSEMRPGDKVVLWQGGQGQAGADAGIYALGELSSVPEPPTPPSDTDESNEQVSLPGPMVTFLYTRLLPEPIRRSSLREHPTLQQMQVLKAPQGTNFRVTQDEWKALLHMSEQPTLDPFETLVQSLVAQGLSFPSELISNYLLALQTKRFVILTGISGTGKTQIALAAARAFQPYAPVAVPQETADVFEIEVYPYMLKYHQMTIPSALTASLALQAMPTPDGSRQIAVVYPVGQTELTLAKELSRNVTKLSFSGPFKAWFDEHLKEGDRFRIKPVEQPDGQLALHVSLPTTETRTQRLANYLLIAVRPDWTDNRGLLGYYNPLVGTYSVPAFLRLLLDANTELKRATSEGRSPHPFFVILDEMNLARVEHYFSDFLSSLESGEAIGLHDVPAIEEGANEDAIAVPRNLVVPSNVYFTGTVNVDETTYMFSPKVLDRAFTIEFNTVDLGAFGSEQVSVSDENGSLILSAFEGQLAPYIAPHSKHWNAFSALDEGKLRKIVIDLHGVLEAEQRHFGYRVANEIARFVLLAHEQSNDTLTTRMAALDLAILQKVLPKLHGTQQELGAILLQIFDFVVFGERRSTVMESSLVERAWTLVGDRLVAGGVAADQYHQPVLPRTAAKVWSMIRRLRQQGFTSFIG